MISNYHTHTALCRHASGSEEEYVEAAISRGLKLLGFSDHTPQIYDGFVSKIRMTPDEVRKYFETAKRLKSKYKGKIELLFGFETEYFPATSEVLFELYSKYPVDYIILGQHYYNGRGEIEHSSVFSPSSDPEKFKKYMSLVTEAINTGAFSAVAHPDVYNFTGNASLYEEECEKFIKEAKRLGIPLELNLLGLRAGRHYPNPEFWKIVGRVGAPVILGCDAHAPKDVAAIENVAEGLAFAKKYGIQPLDRLVLRKPILRR